MSKFIKKNILLIAGFGIIALYFFTRLYNILSFPIFTDEAIYVRWSQIASNDASWRFISLTDGKQPSFVWIAMVLMKFINDPLLAGRLVSVLSGFGSVIGLFFLASELFKNRKIGLLASFVYVIYPFSLVYDRLALYDSMVAMFIIWSLYFEVLLVRKLRFDLALILGMVIGGGMLTKTSANFAIILLPFTLLLFNFKEKKWKNNLGKLAVFGIVALVVGQAMYSVLRLSPFFHIVGEKNLVFIYPFSEWIRSPFGYFVGNFKGLWGWLLDYLSIPFFILAIASFLASKKFQREKLLLLLWFLVPFLALTFFGKVIYPRFILFMTMPLIALGAYTLYHMLLVKKTYLKIIVAIVFLGTFVINDYLILTNFFKAGIPRADKYQLLAGWPSGVGVSETAKFLAEKSKNQKIYVATQGTFGLMPFALEIYFQGNPNVTVKGFWPIDDKLPQELADAARKMPAYAVFYQPCTACQQTGVAPKEWPVEKIFQIERIEDGSYYTFYEIKEP